MATSSASAPFSCLGCYEDGALAELVAMPVEKLHPLPAAMPLRLAALGEPGSIAMQAVNRGTPVAGETALVLGCGPIVLLSILFLSELGIIVIASDLYEHRLELALMFVCTASITVGNTMCHIVAYAVLLGAVCPLVTK